MSKDPSLSEIKEIPRKPEKSQPRTKEVSYPSVDFQEKLKRFNKKHQKDFQIDMKEKRDQKIRDSDIDDLKQKIRESNKLK